MTRPSRRAKRRGLKPLRVGVDRGRRAKRFVPGRQDESGMGPPRGWDRRSTDTLIGGKPQGETSGLGSCGSGNERVGRARSCTTCRPFRCSFSQTFSCTS